MHNFGIHPLWLWNTTHSKSIRESPSLIPWLFRDVSGFYSWHLLVQRFSHLPLPSTSYSYSWHIKWQWCIISWSQIEPDHSSSQNGHRSTRNPIIRLTPWIRYQDKIKYSWNYREDNTFQQLIDRISFPQCTFYFVWFPIEVEAQRQGMYMFQCANWQSAVRELQHSQTIFDAMI